MLNLIGMGAYIGWCPSPLLVACRSTEVSSCWPLKTFHATVRTAREKSGFKAGLRRREKNATEAGAGRSEKPAPDTRAAPPEAHESLISPKTVAVVPLTGLSFILPFRWETISEKRLAGPDFQ